MNSDFDVNWELGSEASTDTFTGQIGTAGVGKIVGSTDGTLT